MINIPQLDEQLMAFVRTPAESSEKAFKKMGVEIQKLKTLFADFEKKAEKLQGKFQSIEIPANSFSVLHHASRFLLSYQHNLISKYERVKKHYINGCLEKISKLLGFMNFCQSYYIYAHVQIGPFCAFLDKEFENTQIKLNKIAIKIKKIISRLNYRIPTLLNALPSQIRCRRVIKRTFSALTPSKQLPCNDENIFDRFFPEFVIYNNLFDTFKPIIDKIIKKQDFLTDFQTKLDELIQFLQCSTSDGMLVIRLTLIRYLYSQSYWISSPFTPSKDKDLFLYKCSTVRSYSPSDLALTESYFSPTQFAAPISSLLQDPSMEKIISELSGIEFQNNPVDIINILSTIISELDDFAKKNEMARKLGQFLWIAEDRQMKPMMLSFDDCYSLFFIILSLRPPNNCLEIADWLNQTPEFFKSMKFSQSKMIFIVAAKEMTTFTLEKFATRGAGDDPIDKDPLGISKE